MGRAAATVVCAVALVLVPRLGRAGYWVWQDDDPATAPSRPSVQFAPQFAFWTAEFNRSTRACRFYDTPFAYGPVAEPGGEGEAAQEQPVAFPGGCYTENSGEIGIGAGGEVTFRMIGPLHASFGAQLLYTFPNRDYELKNQIIVPFQFGAMLTWPEWDVRPLLAAKISPILYLTDDSRDFALGAEAGLAWRVPGWGDVTFTVAHHEAKSLTGWQIQIGLLPY